MEKFDLTLKSPSALAVWEAQLVDPRFEAGAQLHQHSLSVGSQQTYTDALEL
jgi:hypothetical protein